MASTIVEVFCLEKNKSGIHIVVRKNIIGGET